MPNSHEVPRKTLRKPKLRFPTGLEESDVAAPQSPNNDSKIPDYHRVVPGKSAEIPAHDPTLPPFDEGQIPSVTPTETETPQPASFSQEKSGKYTNALNKWLGNNTEHGRRSCLDILTSPEGEQFLASAEGRAWIRSPLGNQFLASPEGEKFKTSEAAKVLRQKPPQANSRAQAHQPDNVALTPLKTPNIIVNRDRQPLTLAPRVAEIARNLSDKVQAIAERYDFDAEDEIGATVEDNPFSPELTTTLAAKIESTILTDKFVSDHTLFDLHALAKVQSFTLGQAESALGIMAAMHNNGADALEALREAATASGTGNPKIVDLAISAGLVHAKLDQARTIYDIITAENSMEKQAAHLVSRQRELLAKADWRDSLKIAISTTPPKLPLTGDQLNNIQLPTKLSFMNLTDMEALVILFKNSDFATSSQFLAAAMLLEAQAVATMSQAQGETLGKQGGGVVNGLVGGILNLLGVVFVDGAMAKGLPAMAEGLNKTRTAAHDFTRILKSYRYTPPTPSSADGSGTSNSMFSAEPESRGRNNATPASTYGQRPVSESEVAPNPFANNRQSAEDDDLDLGNLDDLDAASIMGDL